MKNIMLILLGLFSAQVVSNEIYEQNLFMVETKQIKVESEKQWVEFIKTNMPRTYVYYQRLDTNAQKRVFKSYQENSNKDITELVLLEYRNRG